MSVRLLLSVLSVAISIVLTASSARAQSGSQQAARQSLIDGAMNAASAGDHVQAIDLANRAVAIQSTGSLHGFLAREEFAAGRLADALGDTQVCIRDTPSEPPSRSREFILGWCQGHVEQLRRSVGSIVVDVANPVAGLRVQVSGAVLPPALYGVAYVVTPGRVVVDATVEGSTPMHTEVTVAPGQTVHLAVTLDPSGGATIQAANASDRTAASSAPPSREAETPVASSGLAPTPPTAINHQTRVVRSPIGPVVAAVGVVAVAVGAIAWFVGDGIYNSLHGCNHGMPNPMVCSDPALFNSQVGQVQTYDVLTNVGLWGGAGLVAVGIILFLAVSHRETLPAHSAHVQIRPGSLGIELAF